MRALRNVGVLLGFCKILEIVKLHIVKTITILSQTIYIAHIAVNSGKFKEVLITLARHFQIYFQMSTIECYILVYILSCFLHSPYCIFLYCCMFDFIFLMPQQILLINLTSTWKSLMLYFVPQI